MTMLHWMCQMGGSRLLFSHFFFCLTTSVNSGCDASGVLIPHMFSSIGSIKLDYLRVQRKLGRHPLPNALMRRHGTALGGARAGWQGNRVSVVFLCQAPVLRRRGAAGQAMAEHLRPSDKVVELGGQFQPRLIWNNKPVWLGLHASRAAAEAAYDVAKLLVRA